VREDPGGLKEPDLGAAEFVLVARPRTLTLMIRDVKIARDVREDRVLAAVDSMMGLVIF